MKRRDLLKSLLFAPFVGLLKKISPEPKEEVESFPNDVGFSLGTTVTTPNYTMYFNRILSEEEINFLRREPFCMFNPPKGKWYGVTLVTTAYSNNCNISIF